jgi:type IX secretion system PorP/SprF family membrane protein
MFFRLNIILLLLAVSSFIYAQDNSNLSHYFMNPYSINPSFAGTDGRPSFFLTYRKQWVDIIGAPTIANFSFQTPTGKRMGFGLNVTNSERGILNTTSAYLSNSIAISFSDKVAIRFGASVGAASNSVDFSEVDNISDPALVDLLDQNTYLIGNVGLSFQAKYFNLGVAMPNIFTNELASSEIFTQGDIEPLNNLIVFASNRFYITKDHKHIFEPFIMYRYSDVLPPQIEAAAIVHLNHVVWFGGSYKEDFGISALGGIKLKKVFGLGYSYSIQNSGDNEINSATHEIQLNLLLGGRKKGRLVYSFVDAELPKRKSKRQLAIEEQHKLAEQKKIEEEKVKHEAALKAKEEAVAKEVEAKKEEAEKLQAQKEEAERQTELETQQKEIAQQAVEGKEPEIIERNTEPILIDKPVKQVTESQPTEDGVNLVEKYSTEDRVIVSRGGHLLELGKGEYVIVGVFTTYELAEKYSDDLFFRGYQSKFGYITQQGYWYVYVHQSNNIEEARSRRDELRQKRTFAKAWVLSVQ